VIVLKSPSEIERMKSASQIVAKILIEIRQEIKPGVTTRYLDKLAEKLTYKHKAKPAFKGYGGYPNSLCCSINSEVVHGIPSDRRLMAGDIASIDFGVIYDGYYGDAAVTVPVGEVSSNAVRLMSVTEQCLEQAISQAKPGNRLTDISHAVQSHAERHGFSVVRDFVGHGIGRQLHESPQLPNFGKPGKGVLLSAGMVFAIEPMINEFGSDVKILGDGWTAVTADGGLSAHYEHTVAITEEGPVVLTQIES
jgi:methionyl aminopeptidase